MKRILPALALVGLASSCTIVQIDSSDHPDGLRVEGLVDGHLALGMTPYRNLFEAQLLDGDNPGALARVSLANLLAVEVGAVGAAVTIGPLHLGLGTLFYSPYPPNIPAEDDGDPAHDQGGDDEDHEATFSASVEVTTD